MIRRLVVKGGQRERELVLVGTIVVGRDPACDISDDGDALLSRRHTEFAVGPTGVTVRDLGSRNGTYVNGVKTVEAVIEAGDVVQIGHLQVQWVDGTTAPSAPLVLDADDDQTRIGGPRPVPAGPAAVLAATPLRTPASEDDASTVINAGHHVPRSPSSSGSGSGSGSRSGGGSGSAPARASVNVDDDDRTMFPRSAAASGSGPAVAPPPARPAPVSMPPASRQVVDSAVSMPPLAAGTAPPAVRPSSAAFVMAHVGAVAVIVFLVLALPLVAGWVDLNAANGSTGLLTWLAAGAVAGLVATVAVGTRINGRVARDTVGR